MVSTLLIAFIVLRILQQVIESALAYLNIKFVSNPANQVEAKQYLSLSSESIEKSLAYAKDRYSYGQFTAWVQLTYTLIFLAVGGLGLVERFVLETIPGEHPILHGLAVFAILGALSFVASIPDRKSVV